MSSCRNQGLLMYVYIYIYSHPQTDCFIASQLFHVARQNRFSKLGLKPSWLKCQSKILLHSYKETSVSKRIFKHKYITFVLFTYILITATESSIHSKSLALRKWQSLLPSLESSTRLGVGEYIYIYIYIYTCLPWKPFTASDLSVCRFLLTHKLCELCDWVEWCGSSLWLRHIYSTWCPTSSFYECKVFCLNSEVFFSLISYHAKARETNLPDYFTQSWREKGGIYSCLSQMKGSAYNFV